MNNFKTEETVEIIVNKYYGRDGQQTLANMANQLGIYLYVYFYDNLPFFLFWNHYQQFSTR